MKNRYMKIASAVIIIFCIAVTGFLVKAYFDGEFNSVETLQAYIKRFGVFAPVMLTVIQAAQVVVPILPGFLGCSVGAVMFGCIGGFCCNYIGIVAGSLAAFVLARKFGIKLVESIFPKDKIKNGRRKSEKASRLQPFYWRQ